GTRIHPPSGFEQSIPMVIFTLQVIFTSGAVTLTIERRRGILRRLASSPISRGAVVLRKWGARMVLGLIQIAFATIAGSVLFHIRWGVDDLHQLVNFRSNPAAVIPHLSAMSAAALGAGYALSGSFRFQ